MSTEHTILSNLLYNDEYARRVLPFLADEYFTEAPEKALYNTFNEYWEKYNMAPTKEALRLEVTNRDDINDDQFNDAIGIIDENLIEDFPNMDWLVDTTEEWCQEQAISKAVMDSISIIDGDDETRTRHAIPDLLKEALGVSFSTEVGHDYFDDSEDRYDFYHEEKNRLPFDIELLNKITNGGVTAGTLNVILAGTNVGKTLFMVHMASGYLRKGKNVLYITLEMAEEEIAKRVDANNFDMPIGKVDKISRDKYAGAIQRIRSKTNGKLIIKQFPTGSAHVGHFRTLLQELWLKKNFKPDAIVVDYIGICASSRMKMGNTSSYFYIKAVAEELRGLGIEFEVPVWTAVQTTRTGFSSNDVDITDTAESFGLPATADLMLAAMRTDELDKLNQMIMKQLKNRYANKNVYTKFLIGSEFEKQKLFDVDNNAQEKLNDHNSPDSDDGLSDQEADPTSNRKRLTKRKKNKFKDYD